MSRSEPTDTNAVTVSATETPMETLADAITGHDGRRAQAVETARTLAAVDPETASTLVDPLVAVATKAVAPPETATRRAATHALVRIGRAYPEALAPHADALVALVDDAEHGIAENAAGICAAVADSRPDAVAGVREELLALLDGGGHATGVDVLEALGTVAESDPAAVRPAIERLCRLLDSEAPLVAAAACRALGPLGPTDADRLAAHDERFAALLDHEHPDCRAAAGRTLARTLPFAPREMPVAREGFVALLSAETPSVRRAGADAVVSLAQTDPGAFEDPVAVALVLREARGSIPLSSRSEDAVEEALSALESVPIDT